MLKYICFTLILTFVLVDIVSCETFCSKKYNCDPESRYRTFDGTCNNLIKPWLGSVNTPYKRLTDPIYDDMNTGTPRSKCTNNHQRSLPSPRKVSFVVHSPLEKDSKINSFAVLFGQLIAHDLARSAPTKDAKGRFVSCANKAIDSIPQCMRIQVPAEDKVNADVPFMATVRTEFTQMDWNCQKKCREQLNSMTHWLDLSALYGNSKEDAAELRTNKGGLLKTTKVDGGERAYFPLFQGVPCSSKNPKAFCFQSGDVRVNENMLLASIQNIFHRQHNAIAEQLKIAAPTWSDEKLFQEARRVLIGQYQHIIYKEWLPLIIGSELMDEFKLTSKHQEYDQEIVPQVINEFTTAAFRFGHSMIKNTYFKKDRNYKTTQSLPLGEVLVEANEAYRTSGLDAIARGLFTEQGSFCDRHFTDQIHNHLFQNNGSMLRRTSLDTLNINRGRDHGIPSYTLVRNVLGFEHSFGFQDFFEIDDDETIDFLQSVYEDVDDIDLYTGGMSENPVAGGTVGMTFARIIAQQFLELKFGDRYFYLNSFSQAELNEIKKSNLSRLLCDNLNISSVQKRPFQMKDSKKNRMVKCSNLRKVNYSVFTR